MANIARDGQLLQYARNIAQELLDDDSLLEKPENQLLVHQLKRLKNTPSDWSSIS
jgi:ATP-dependent DNA helicase RecG